MAVRFGMTIAEIIAQLTRGFRSVAGRAPDGLEKIKIQQEAVQRFKEMNKIVDMQGRTLDPSKTIMGGTQEGAALKSGIMKATGAKPIEARVDISKYIKDGKPDDDKLNALVDRDMILKEEADSLATTGKNYERFQKISAERKNIREIIEDVRKMFTEDMAQGGRAGFKMGRRAFLKLMGSAAAGIGALKAGALKMFGKETAKNIPQVVTTPPVAGKPAWFDTVVNRVIAEGDDVTKQFAYKERMQVNTKQISPTEEVTVYRDLDDGSVRINYGAKMRIDETKPYEKGNIGRASNDPDQVDLIVREGEVIEPDLKTGKGGGKTKASFEASEAEPRAVGGPEDADIEFDAIREVDNVDDLMQDVSVLEEFATGKKLTGKKAAKAKKKREDFQKFTEDNQAQAEYLENKYGPYDDSAMDDFASGGIAKLLGE